MDTQIAIVFSWDPRARTWVRERGPDDAARPPAAPIDPDAVQTYFLDPQNGRWTGTVLGLRARQMAEDLAGGYRTALVAGLAVGEVEERGAAVAGAAGPRPRLAAGIGVLLLLAGMAIVASQTLFGAWLPAAAALMVPAEIAPAAIAPTAIAPAAIAPAAIAPAASDPATSAPTPAPTPRPPQTVRLSARLPNGTQIVFAGPAAIAKGTDLRGVFSIVLPPALSYESLTVYFGDPNTPGAMTSAFARPDVNGNIVLSISGQIPRGAQPLRVQYGQTRGVYTLGTIAVQ